MSCLVAFWRATNRKIRLRIEIAISDNQIAREEEAATFYCNGNNYHIVKNAELVVRTKLRRTTLKAQNGVKIAEYRQYCSPDIVVISNGWVSIPNEKGE